VDEPLLFSPTARTLSHMWLFDAYMSACSGIFWYMYA
jgi:hypothetical protein